MESEIVNEAIEQLTNLTPDLQKQVLDYIKGLNHSVKKGTPGKRLLRFAGTIPMEDLRDMARAIEKDCGKIDLNEW